MKNMTNSKFRFLSFVTGAVLTMGSLAQATGSGPSSPDIDADVVFRDPYTPSQLPVYTCTSVTTLTLPSDGSQVQIPPRSATGSGVCYAMKLISGGTYNPSSVNPHDPEVTSKNHDTGSGDHLAYSMGAATVNLFLQGERSMKISGGPGTTDQIHVDNFVFVGLAPSSQIKNPYYYEAYGTVDSAVLTVPSNAVIVGQPLTPSTTYAGVVLFTPTVASSVTPVTSTVTLKTFGQGGTTAIAPLILDNKVSSQVNYTLNLRALDAGSIGYVSDLYVLFQ